jgi:anti-sigma regulatory factor (Ser/Thr protein kinase)
MERREGPCLRGVLTEHAIWPIQSHLELRALPTAVPCARLHAKQVLWEWDMGAFAESVELVVSELVTNAVRASRALEHVPPVRLQLSSDKARVLVEVWDGSHRPPLQAGIGETPALDEKSGRGLFLVAAISTEWDWYRSPECTGKVVWAMVEDASS